MTDFLNTALSYLAFIGLATLGAILTVFLIVIVCSIPEAIRTARMRSSIQKQTREIQQMQIDAIKSYLNDQKSFNTIINNSYKESNDD